MTTYDARVRDERAGAALVAVACVVALVTLVHRFIDSAVLVAIVVVAVVALVAIDLWLHR